MGSSISASEIIPGPSVVKSTSNLSHEDPAKKPQEDVAEPKTDVAALQADEISNEITAKISKKSEAKNSKLPAKEGELTLKRKKPTKDGLPVKREKTNSLPISQMVMESIKALRKRKGASVEAILEHMEGQYKVNVKLAKRHVSRYLSSAVQKGIVEQLNEEGEDGRFKIKKAEQVTKVGKKLNASQKMVKAEKDAKIGPKLSNDQKKIKAKEVAKVEQKSKPKDGLQRGKVAKVK